MSLKLNTSWKYRFSLLCSEYVLLLHFASAVAALVIQAKSPCDNTNNPEGVISSPNYPSPYASQIKCEWEIPVPSNSWLEITVQDLDIYEDDDCPKSPCCSQEGLSISRNDETVLLCGNNTRRTITVFQPSTLIRYFSSRTNKSSRGFRIRYAFVKRDPCKADENRCRNGKCLPARNFCDGFDDCGDGSDEIRCPHVSLASRYDPLLSKKIPERESRVVESQQGLCKEGRVPCPLSPDHCYSPLADACDDKFDCPKGEDEVDCVPECPKQISCSSGDGCYYPVQRCNSIRNCRDNSDETGCPAEPCVALQFTCLNGACISGSAVCDGDDDCGDLSDEKNCTKSSFMKAAVVGLLTCIMLFCIVLGCMYHVYTARLRASATFVHQIETEPSDDDFVYREPPPAYSVNDPRIMTYSTPDIADGFFENDRALRFQRNRSLRRGRRQSAPGSGECASTPRSRPRATEQDTPGGGGAGDDSSRSQPKSETSDKGHGSGSDFHRRLEFYGFNCTPPPPPPPPPPTQTEQSLPTNSCRNESPCSSPSVSPSRGSVTSCTSLEEIEDLVSLFHH